MTTCHFMTSSVTQIVLSHGPSVFVRGPVEFYVFSTRILSVDRGGVIMGILTSVHFVRCLNADPTFREKQTVIQQSALAHANALNLIDKNADLYRIGTSF